jgi:hypothetical protein
LIIFRIIPEAQTAANARATFMIKFFHSVTLSEAIRTPPTKIHKNPTKRSSDVVNFINHPIKRGNISD